MNNQIFFFFYNFAHQSASTDKLIVFFAVYFPFAVIFAAAMFLLMHHEVFKAESVYEVLIQKKKEILLAFFSGTFAWILAVIFKLFFHTLRPVNVFPQVHSLFTETDFAFPSGHATFFFALAFSLFFTHRKAGALFLAFAVIISMARVSAGVHFPIDILGGACLGFMISFIINKIQKQKI